MQMASELCCGRLQPAATFQEEAALADPQPRSRSQQSQQWSAASVRELAEDMPDPQEDELVDIGEGIPVAPLHLSLALEAES